MEKTLGNFKKLLDFRSVIFLWSIILYSDVFYLFLFHHSIANINYKDLIKLIEAFTIVKLITFFVFFSVFYIFIIPIIDYFLEIAWISIYYKWDWLYKKLNNDTIDAYEKNNYCIYSEFLKDYSIMHDNKVMYDIYKNYKLNANKSAEFNIISLFVIIFSGSDYLLSKLYNQGVCILDILSNSLLPGNITKYLILGYIILIIILILNIFSGYTDYYKDHIMLSRETVHCITNDLKNFKNTENPINHNNNIIINSGKKYKNSNKD